MDTDVLLTRLWMENFRNHAATELSFPRGLTVITGANAEGKTNILEAIGYLASLRSFRGAGVEVMVRDGCDSAVVRAELESGERRRLIEAQLLVGGRGRVQVDRQPLRRARDLLGVLRVVVFSPDDLVLVKGGPTERRRFLDDVLVSLRPRNAALRADLERILRQRNTLLRQAGGRPDAMTLGTLDVWDEKLVEVGTALAAARRELTDRLLPHVRDHYAALSESEILVELDYQSRWEHDGLRVALAAAREEDLRRRVTTVGPHRDELVMTLGALPARSHASQGEQRSLVLSLRLATQRLITEEVGSAPLILLDDVLSELDSRRARRLMSCLSGAQTILTSATGTLPAGTEPTVHYEVRSGEVSEASAGEGSS